MKLLLIIITLFSNSVLIGQTIHLGMVCYDLKNNNPYDVDKMNFTKESQIDFGLFTTFNKSKSIHQFEYRIKTINSLQRQFEPDLINKEVRRNDVNHGVSYFLGRLFFQKKSTLVYIGGIIEFQFHLGAEVKGSTITQPNSPSNYLKTIETNKAPKALTQSLGLRISLKQIIWTRFELGINLTSNLSYNSSNEETTRQIETFDFYNNLLTSNKVITSTNHSNLGLNLFTPSIFLTFKVN
ncbi:MAG: hypothetical protein ACPG6V_03680 [Flavobacteriales bacterium]